jgi:CBS domain-containing protein
MPQIGKNVKMILESKSPAVWSVAPENTVYEALALMAEKGIGAVLVMEGDHVAGIMSERDYARKVALKGKTAESTLVSEIMTKHVIYVDPTQPVEEIMALMVGKNIRHLPVLDDGKVVGIVSIGDVVRSLISEQQLLIEQLESYIRGY